MTRFIFWMIVAGITSGVFLFRVPGFHYDEAWIAQLASQIAFDRGTWPVFGMNHYTVPIMSYILAAGFKVVGHPSLELARVIYWKMNLVSFALFYIWIAKRIGRRNKTAAWVFALLWVTLPLSVFNQRVFLEVTTAYAFFGSIALWGLSEGFKRGKNLWLALGLTAIALGAASHILFLGGVWAALWACWKESPETFENPRVKWAVTLMFAPMLVLLTAVFLSPIGGGERAKAAIVMVVTLFVLVALWRKWWQTSLSHALLRLSTWILYLVSAGGLFFFFLFEISGVWPISQTTGNVNWFAVVPGFTIAGILLYAIFSAAKPEAPFRFFRALWLVTCALTVISIYKPTSARYWELSLITFLITGAWAVSGLEKHRKALVTGLIAASLLNVAVLGQSYFADTLEHGATSDSYHWLWVHDSSGDYRPVVRAYQELQGSKDFCEEDSIQVDEGRNAFVLQVYRGFARKQGLEKPCETGHLSAHYNIGSKPSEPLKMGLGDLQIF
jgi:hypothetical protein